MRFSDRDTTLVSFVLGIIQALQQLGTVPALDMNAYLSPLLNMTLPDAFDPSLASSVKHKEIK